MAGKTWHNVHFQRIKENMPIFFGVPHAINEEDIHGADVVIIGAPFTAGWSKNTAA